MNKLINIIKTDGEPDIITNKIVTLEKTNKMESKLTPQRLNENGKVNPEFYEFALECCKNGIEIYVEIDGYKGLYEVSNFGAVRSLDRIINCAYGKKRKITGVVKNHFIMRGYKMTDLQIYDTRKHFLIHRLVSIAFIPNPDNKEDVNHIDFNRQNNNLVNLEWNTRKENICHARDNGRLNPHSKGKFGKDSMRSKALSQYTKDGIYIRDFEGLRDASRITGVSSSGIGQTCRKIQNSAGGYIWKYKELQT